MQGSHNLANYLHNLDGVKYTTFNELPLWCIVDSYIVNEAAERTAMISVVYPKGVLKTRGLKFVR